MTMEASNMAPRRNIISVRVSDEELMFLTRLLRRRNTTISDLIREALGGHAFVAGKKFADAGKRRRK